MPYVSAMRSEHGGTICSGLFLAGPERYTFPMLLDAHAHVVHGPYVQRSYRTFLNATTVREFATVALIAARDNTVFPFFGVHPWHVHTVPDDWREKLRTYVSHMDCGVGEIGLDSIYPQKHSYAADLERQVVLFREQLALALEHDKPVAIHCVKAWDRLFEELEHARTDKKMSAFRGLVHYFSGSYEVAKRLISYGFYISFRPVEHPAQEELVRSIPLEHLLLESDEPGGFTEEQLLAHYTNVARIRGMDVTEFTEVIAHNGQVLTHRAPAR